MKRILTAVMLFLVAFTATAATKPYTRNVAVIVYKDAEPLDWTGPFEVWNDAGSFGSANGEKAFNVYIVSKTDEPLNAQGLIVKPNYSIANAPKPDVIIIPGGPSNNITDDPAFFAWTKNAAQEAEVVQTVCTGAFVMAKAGNEGLHGPGQAEGIRRFESELDNLRAAIALALEGCVDPIIAVKLEVAMQGFRTLRGYSTEGRRNVRAALARAGSIAPSSIATSSSHHLPRFELVLPTSLRWV